MGQQAKGFTSGPWCVCRIHDKPGLDSTVTAIRIEQTSGECLPIAHMEGVTAEDHANAHLIAAAPLMYSAGERVIASFKAIGDCNTPITNAMRQECEAAVLALNAALSAARGAA